MDLIESSQADKETVINEALEALLPASLFGQRTSTTNLLTWGYYGGNMMVGTTLTAIADGTVALTASQTNYVEADSAGAVTTNTSAFTSGRFPICTITTNTTSITAIADKRAILLGRVDYQALILSCSDEGTALTAGNGKVKFRMPYAYKVTAVRASLTTAQATGGIFTVDINDGGTTILSTKLTIDNTEKTSTTAATPAVISDADLADDAEISVDIDSLGDGTATGLKVTLIGYRV